MFKYESMVTEENANNEVKFTNAEYLRQCDVIAEGTANELARELWEKVRDEFSDYVDRMVALSHIDCELARRQQKAKLNKLKRHLEAYEVAFSVMGCKLEVIWDNWCDEDRYPSKIIHSVKLYEGNHTMGYVRFN